MYIYPHHIYMYGAGERDVRQCEYFVWCLICVSGLRSQTVFVPAIADATGFVAMLGGVCALKARLHLL